MSNTKTGGRTKGTPNKRSAEIQHKLAEMGCDPIEGLARIAQQAESDAQGVLENALEAAITKAIEMDGDTMDPEFLHAVAKKLKTDVGVRLSHLQLAQSCYNALRKHWAPELKSIEITAGSEGGFEALDDEVVNRMAQAVLKKAPPAGKK